MLLDLSAHPICALLLVFPAVPTQESDPTQIWCADPYVLPKIYIFSTCLSPSTQPCTPNISTIPLQARALLSALPPLTTLNTNACSNTRHPRASRISSPCQNHVRQNQPVKSRYPIPTRVYLPRKMKSKDGKYGITPWKNPSSIHSNCECVSFFIKLSD